MSEKLKGLLIVNFAYLLTFVAGALTFIYGLLFAVDLQGSLFFEIVKWLFLADVVGTVVIFAFSYFFKNSSMYDPYWSVIPIWLALFLAWFGWTFVSNSSVLFRTAIVVFFVLFWGLRLTWNWFRGWSGMKHEDWRYVDLQEQHGSLYWLVSFAGIHMMPTVLVFLGCLPLVPALAPNIMETEGSLAASMGLFDFIGAFLCSVGIFFEFVGDNQKRRFVLSNPPKGSFLKTGLWAKSRHPNYFGEITFWWGLGFFGLAGLPAFSPHLLLLCFGGALAITLLFVFISIPMMDKRMVARREGYAEFMKEVPALFPRLF